MKRIKVVRGWRALIGLAGVLSLGCGAKSVDLGDDGPDASLQDLGDGGPAGPSLAGIWLGTVASEAFLSTSKTLRLEIDAAGAGTLLVGNAPLPPPTDPSVGSPPEAEADAAQATGLLLHLYEGATYSTQNVRVSGTSYDFEVDLIAAFAPWCTIQTPVALDGGGYRCRRNLGGGVDRTNGVQCYTLDPNTAMPAEEEDCLALWLCSIDLIKGCFCTESECHATSGGERTTMPFGLKLEDEGAVLRGGLTTIDGYGSAVELWRQP